MPLITIREHGKLRIGEPSDDGLAVPESQADRLSQLKAVYGFDVFKYVNKTTVSAQQYVGTVQVGSLTVEVLPKVEGIGDTTLRRNLVAMLSVALDLDISEGEAAQVGTQRLGLLEALIRLFCQKLFVQVHRGLVRRYEGREENLSVLRGRLAVTRQIRLNAAHPERLYCQFDEFMEDNPLNQILKAAVRFLLKASRDLTNQRQLSELLFIFDEVSDMPRHGLPWSKASFDRLNDRFRPCFNLASLFLRNTPPNVTAGRAESLSLFFDMNSLFEEYVGRVAACAFREEGCHVTRQGPQRALAYDEANQRNAFLMKPDIVAQAGGETSWIMDTKWKELTPEEVRDGVAQADVYQMYAYANGYQCPDVVLLYPHHAGLGTLPGTRASYRLHQWTGTGRHARIRVATLDLTDLKKVPDQLRQIMKPSPPL